MDITTLKKGDMVVLRDGSRHTVTSVTHLAPRDLVPELYSVVTKTDRPTSSCDARLRRTQHFLDGSLSWACSMPGDILEVLP